MRRAQEELSKSRALWFYLLQLIYSSRFPISKGKGDVYVIHSSVYWSKTGWLKWQKLTSYCLGSSMLRSRYQYGQDFGRKLPGGSNGCLLAVLLSGGRAESRMPSCSQQGTHPIVSISSPPWRPHLGPTTSPKLCLLLSLHQELSSINEFWNSSHGLWYIFT